MKGTVWSAAMRSSAAALLVTAAALAGCGEDTPASDLPFASVRQAIDKGDEEFEGYFETVKGTKVAWSGRVVRSDRVFGDDYAEEGVLYVDLDAPGQGSEAADVVLDIPPSEIDARKPGDPVSFTAVIREYVTENGKPLLKLQLVELGS